MIPTSQYYSLLEYCESLEEYKKLYQSMAFIIPLTLVLLLLVGVYVAIQNYKLNEMRKKSVLLIDTFAAQGVCLYGSISCEYRNEDNCKGCLTSYLLEV